LNLNTAEIKSFDSLDYAVLRGCLWACLPYDKVSLENLWHAPKLFSGSCFALISISFVWNV